MSFRLVYVTASTKPRIASYRMAADTVRLWRESGHEAVLAHIGDVPSDGDAYVFCKCIPKERPRRDALVAFHMHDFWDERRPPFRFILEQLSDAPVDVLVPCSEPYEQKLTEIARSLGIGIRIVWCPENPVFAVPPVAKDPPPDGPFRVGFHGTGSSLRFLSGDPARGLERVAKKYPLEVVVLTTLPRVTDDEAVKTMLRLRRPRVRYVQWTMETHEHEIASWDAAILPASHDSDFSFIKSNNRLREAVRLGVPVVVQRGNPDMEWFSEDGRNCMVAGDSEEWYLKTRRVLRYAGTRRTLKARASQRLMAVYGPDAVMERWKAVFDR